MTNSLVEMVLRFTREPYQTLDKLYVGRDREHIKRTRNIRLIPTEDQRRGGKYSYAEWAHVIGIFQTLLLTNVAPASGIQLLDVGCGTGLMAIAAEPLLRETGKYVGVDVSATDIEFCKRHYTDSHFQFEHFDLNNAMYAPDQSKLNKSWTQADSSFDVVTALSVWTHLAEPEAVFYFKEIDRVMKPGGKAIITFFTLDEDYEKSLSRRTNAQGRYHSTPQTDWVFDQKAYGSEYFFCPKWVDIPENAIGISEAGLELLLKDTNLRVTARYPGNWKEMPGVFFQDVLIFEKRLS